ncbi:hypothetical protein RCL1_002328 [Eukaryota sp. TZLM3-RCL]
MNHGKSFLVGVLASSIGSAVYYAGPMTRQFIKAYNSPYFAIAKFLIKHASRRTGIIQKHQYDFISRSLWISSYHSALKHLPSSFSTGTRGLVAGNLAHLAAKSISPNSQNLYLSLKRGFLFDVLSHYTKPLPYNTSILVSSIITGLLCRCTDVSLPKYKKSFYVNSNKIGKFFVDGNSIRSCGRIATEHLIGSLLV